MGPVCEEGRAGLGLLVPLLIPSVFASANVQKESKENQWLGVSVRSQGPGGKIVVSTTTCDNAEIMMICVHCVPVHRSTFRILTGHMVWFQEPLGDTQKCKRWSRSLSI